MIRVAFRYDDTRLFARLVCFLRGGDSAHCEVAYRWPDCPEDVYSLLRGLDVTPLKGNEHECVSASFLDGGVRSKVIDLPASKWRIYEVPGDPAEVKLWLSLHQGQRYDWPAFIGFTALRRFKGLSQRWFCSEVVAVLLSLRAPHRFDPYDTETVCMQMVDLGLAERVQ